MLEIQLKDIDKTNNVNELLELKKKIDKSVVDKNFDWYETQEENRMLEKIDKKLIDLGHIK
ncbi:MAG TPA: hypothetical protein VMX17_05085 [Candidatus Glassbacteria bacterium]|nr:hypothetical protein [Candidatus Glassbacteria bacterium]